MTPPTRTEAPSGALRARDGLVALTCVLLGLGYGCAIWLRRGAEPAQQYLAGYLIELSLSADNVFVFALVFEQFRVDPLRRRRLLFWGLSGAIVFRSALLIAGVGAIGRFTWIIPVFGALVLAAGIRIATRRGRKAFDPTGNPAIRFFAGRVPATLAALAALEAADLVFALDSLPAVLAVTHDAAIAVASNLFAILGLRSLFFVVSGAMRTLRYLNAGLATVLSFVGVKMLAEPWVRIPTAASLAIITALLALSVGASLLPRREGRQ
jgi:tellurite resistance protein TerC